MKKRADGRWCLTKQINGKRMFFYSTEKTERKAFSDIQNQIDALEKESEKKYLFKSVAEEWLEKKDGEPLAINTARSYRYMMNDVIAYFGEVFVSDIDEDAINEFIHYLLTVKMFSARTVRYKLFFVRSVLLLAKKKKYISENPFDYMDDPKLPRSKPRRPASDDAEKYIRSHPDVWLFPYFMLYTGMRKGEALAIRWSDIDFEKKMIHITKAVVYPHNDAVITDTKTEKSLRDVPLLNDLEAVLKEIPHKKDWYLFGKKSDPAVPMTRAEFNDQMEKYVRESGVTFTSHQLRHSFATLCFEKGVPVKSVQNILGHSTFAVTMDVYTEFRNASLEEARNILNN